MEGESGPSLVQARAKRNIARVTERSFAASFHPSGGPGAVSSEMFCLLDGHRQPPDQLRHLFQTLRVPGFDGVRETRFLIGAADGFDDAQRAEADLLISFGRATWPHMMARAMLAEQLWRAASILANHPYHREG